MTTTRPITALYVHVPFCASQCGYCDFYTTPLRRTTIEPLVSGLISELRQAREQVPVELETVFIGGGTPTTLPNNELARLLAACQTAIATPDAEFTVEANPASVDAAKAEALAAGGVNRVSMGAQSFQPAELRVLDRTHQPEQVGATIDICRSAGIDNISVDLIFGVPGQRVASWRRNIAAAVELAPDHLSCYGLTYEPGTKLFRRLEQGRITPLDEDLEADMYEAMIDDLAQAGYEHYEISNFARPGRACRHNLVYWQNEPYLGIGPSAAGYVEGLRYKNVPDTRAYIEALRAGTSPIVEHERLSPVETAGETAMLALRLVRGIDRRAFTGRFGTDPAELFAAAIARHTADGLLEVTDASIRLTRRGLLLANRVARDFLRTAAESTSSVSS